MEMDSSHLHSSNISTTKAMSTSTVNIKNKSLPNNTTLCFSTSTCNDWWSISPWRKHTSSHSSLLKALSSTEMWTGRCVQINITKRPPLSQCGNSSQGKGAWVFLKNCMRSCFTMLVRNILCSGRAFQFLPGNGTFTQNSSSTRMMICMSFLWRNRSMLLHWLKDMG